MTTVLITGGTYGIGAGFARRFAADGHDLVLVARGKERLDAVAADLHTRYGVCVDTIEADLTTVEGCARVEDRLRNSTIDILVNNAGHALPAPYPRSPLADEERMIDLLIRVPLRLTQAAIPGMAERRHGVILNIASVAGLLPTGTYGAAKAWLIRFSESLRFDFKDQGIRVLAVVPGFTRTPGAAGIPVADWLWLEVDQVVEEAMKDLRRGAPVSIAGWHFKLYDQAVRHLPRRIVAAMARSRKPRT
ncbi:SDR family NAD(P)-dependent oxidoreductase [Streptomyces sp. So13.3]|uniref:SDR family NAD(P)-dependent oxidoreductase n=1 Tax=Streptomyces TaxID=1883 RepID=UPI001106BEA9|nr:MULTISPECIES: SDR family NAD(P)-dependent oxidoreductase [Streptomyces]QNA70805.1 SDR family NAD(P)-dependent oxidoreductase [Streptomyces sp. So13.3]